MPGHPKEAPSSWPSCRRRFNAMAKHLEEVFDARRELVAWASHDLRAPITSLQAMVEAMADGVVEPQHYIENLHGQVDSSVRSSTTSSRWRASTPVQSLSSLQAVDLGNLVDQCMQRYEFEAVPAVSGPYRRA